MMFLVLLAFPYLQRKVDEIPNYKHQITNKLQLPKFQTEEFWKLEFWVLRFIWYLPAIKSLADPLYYIGGARRRFSGGEFGAWNFILSNNIVIEIIIDVIRS